MGGNDSRVAQSLFFKQQQYSSNIKQQQNVRAAATSALTKLSRYFVVAGEQPRTTGVADHSSPIWYASYLDQPKIPTSPLFANSRQSAAVASPHRRGVLSTPKCGRKRGKSYHSEKLKISTFYIKKKNRPGIGDTFSRFHDSRSPQSGGQFFLFSSFYHM